MPYDFNGQSRISFFISILWKIHLAYWKLQAEQENTDICLLSGERVQLSETRGLFQHFKKNKKQPSNS